MSESRTTPQKHIKRKHIKRPYQKPWVWHCKTPLFWEPILQNPIEVKLANMRAAIAAGADVNELDHAPDPRKSCGRPLDMAVKEDDCNWADLKRNIPVIQLLLMHGADARLEGVLGAPAPLDYARHRATEHPPPELEEMQSFYRTVYVMLRDAAKRLEDKENEGKEGKECHAAQRSKSFFQSCLVA